MLANSLANQVHELLHVPGCLYIIKTFIAFLTFIRLHVQ